MGTTEAMREQVNEMELPLRTILGVLVLLSIAGLSKTSAGESYSKSGASFVADWPAQHAKYQPVPFCEVKVSGCPDKRIDRDLKSVFVGFTGLALCGFEACVAGRQSAPEAELGQDSRQVIFLPLARSIICMQERRNVPG